MPEKALIPGILLVPKDVNARSVSVFWVEEKIESFGDDGGGHT
jgi:hypothetical protein